MKMTAPRLRHRVDIQNFATTQDSNTGAVTDETKNVRIYTGVGTGLRWSSPVGPMQVDVAYGVKTQQLRLHMRLGFTF